MMEEKVILKRGDYRYNEGEGFKDGVRREVGIQVIKVWG
jgi:hypothetical protein